MDMLREKQLELVAVKLYKWLHFSGSPDFHSPKNPEVVRVSYYKRAEELLREMVVK